MKATQNLFLEDRTGARSVRHNEVLVTGHAIDQYLARNPNPPNGSGRDFERSIGRLIASAVRKAYHDANRGEYRLMVYDGMAYVVRFYHHYKKVITCYRHVLDKVSVSEVASEELTHVSYES